MGLNDFKHTLNSNSFIQKVRLELTKKSILGNIQCLSLTSIYQAQTFQLEAQLGSAYSTPAQSWVKSFLVAARYVSYVYYYVESLKENSVLNLTVFVLKLNTSQMWYKKFVEAWEHFIELQKLFTLIIQNVWKLTLIKNTIMLVILRLERYCILNFTKTIYNWHKLQRNGIISKLFNRIQQT